MDVRCVAAADAAPIPEIYVNRRRFVFCVSAGIAVISAPACRRDPPEQWTPIARFMALSALLTGAHDLSRSHAQLYLDALLAAPERASVLDDLYTKAGYGSGAPPRTLEELTARGVFNDKRLRTLADDITIWWYTGIYEGAAGPSVATYTESLAWKSLTYTNAPSTCGGTMGFWAEAPRSR
jgi:hypothetical protein